MNEEEVSTLIKATQDNAQRLGLTWELQTATVSQSFPLRVKFGDEDADHPAESALTVMPRPGDRLYVIAVPPAGNYAIGYVTPPSLRHMGTMWTNNGIVASTPAGGAETAVPSANWDSEPFFVLPPNFIYLAMVDGFVTENTGAACISFVRLRKGTGTGGTQLGLKEHFHPAAFGGQTQSVSYRYFFKNTSGAVATTKLSLTINGVVGGSVFSLYGDGNDPLKVVVSVFSRVSDDVSWASSLATV